jgi:hypothetical protein
MKRFLVAIMLCVVVAMGATSCKSHGGEQLPTATQKGVVRIEQFEGIERGKNPAGLKDFTYHCAHSYWTYHEVASAIFKADGEAVAQKVLEDFRKDYGSEMADALLSYRNTNFNVCD